MFSCTWKEGYFESITPYYMALNKIFELLFRAQDWTNRRLLLIIDEAQGSYSYTPLWNDLIKGLSPDAGPLVALFSSYGSPSSKPLEQFTPTASFA